MSRIFKMSALRRGLAGLAVSMCVGAIAALVMDARHQMGQLLTATQDNVEWSISQWETEVVSMENALLEAMFLPRPDLANVRLRFDIFYSRVDTMRSSPIYSGFRSTPALQQDLKQIFTFFDIWSKVVDGPDAALRTKLPQFLNETHETRRLVRKSVVIGNDFFARKAAQQRRQIARTLMRVAALTVTLVAILLLLVGALLQLARQRTRDVHHHRAILDRIETIVSTSQDAIIVTDRAGRVIEYNGAAEELFGFSRSDALYCNVADLIIPPEARQRHLDGMERYHKTGQRSMVGQGIVQMKAMRKDGSLFPADVTLATADGPKGEIFVGFLRDISARLEAEDALRQARDRAIAGEKQKAELLAVMSHEMRTPLNGMLGTLELFETGNLTDQQSRFIEIVKNSGQLLLSHVNDVLDVSRLDSGKLVMRKRQFDLIDLLTEVLDSQAGHAIANGNRLTLIPPDPQLRAVYSDPERLRQVLLNLIGNAVKFTNNGEITLEADCINACQEVELRVSDTGQGIDEADLTRIFEDFVSIDASYGRSNTGTGLGLAISQRLTKALGGELGAESIPGEGSVFWIRLPMAPVASVIPMQQVMDPQTHGPEPDLPPLKVLVVEDNEINRMVTRALLERAGHQVHEATDGHRGIAMAQSEEFDLILMDISMPRLDGIEATRRIRQAESKSTPVPIIATTAHALPDEVQKFLHAGMNEVLVTPLRADTMFETISRALGYPEKPIPDTNRPNENMTSLLCQDHLEDLSANLSPPTVRASADQLRQELDLFFSQMEDIEARRPDSLSEEAHRLAGSAGVFGALQLADHLRKLHQSLIAPTAEVWDDHLPKAKACWLATQEALTVYFQAQGTNEAAPPPRTFKPNPL